MNLPLTLYEYIAIFLPGTVALYALAGVPFLHINLATDKPSELILLGVFAFLLGHVMQAMGRALLKWLRWRLPWLRNPKAELIRRSSPVPHPVTWVRIRLSAFWNRTRIARWIWNLEVCGLRPIQIIYLWLVDWPLRFLTFVVIPWPDEPMFPQERIDEIKRLVKESLSGIPDEKISDRMIFTECFLAVKDDLDQYHQFSTQADLFRGLIPALVLLEVVSVKYGPPLLKSSAEAGPHYAQWALWAIAYLILLCLERHQHFEYNAARVVYNSFLERKRKERG